MELRYKKVWQGRGTKCWLLGQREGKGEWRKVPTTQDTQDEREVTMQSVPDWVARSMFLGGLGKCVNWKMPLAVFVNTLVLPRKRMWTMKNSQFLLSVSA